MKTTGQGTKTCTTTAIKIGGLTAVALLLPALGACSGIQSALDSRSSSADAVNLLTVIMFLGSIAIFAIVMTALWIAIEGPEKWREKIGSSKSIVIGGLVFPIVTLTVLLFYGFILLAGEEELIDAENPLKISVVGEQWWWRVIYQTEDGSRIESANEIRLPVGTVVEISLTTADTLHSFWLPAYAGKVDMIPGRINKLRIRADETGLVRGQCAEYCGGAHARMSFYSLALEREEFDRWFAQEQREQTDATRSGGYNLFLDTGCGGCHRIRGTEATGMIGPDLTHVGSRHSLGAGTLTNDAENYARWLRTHQRLKPGNKMPAFDFLTNEEIRQLSSFLSSLD